MAIIPMRKGELDFKGLEELCIDNITQHHRVVEIGSYIGESSNIIAQYAGKLYCIDPWQDGLIETGSAKGSRFYYNDMSKVEALFDAAVSHKANVIKLRGTSDDLADVFGECSVDFVYIDSLHTYEFVRNDIRRWWSKVKRGGAIGGHNHSSRWPGVIKAVAESFGKADRLYRDSSWVVRKIDDRRFAA